MRHVFKQLTATKHLGSLENLVYFLPSDNENGARDYTSLLSSFIISALSDLDFLFYLKNVTVSEITQVQTELS